MADITTTTKSLKIETGYADGDTRMITLTNPRSDVTEEDIRAVETFAKTNEILIGDKTGASLAAFNHATIVTVTRRELDLS